MARLHRGDMRAGAVGAALLAGLAAVGCSESDPGEDAPPGADSPTSVAPSEQVPREPLADRCGTLPGRVDGEAFVVSSPTGESLYAVMAGSGTRALVLVHGSGDRGVCNWVAEMPWLVTAGYRVIAYDAACVGNSTCLASDPRPVDDLVAVLDEARRQGARDSVVIAASAGGPLAIEVAARDDAPLRATVALSPAGLDGAVHPDVARAARVPVLYVLARDDTAATAAEVTGLYKASRAGGAVLRILPAGAGHAQATLYTADGEPSPFRQELLEFIAAQTRARSG